MGLEDIHSGALITFSCLSLISPIIRLSSDLHRGSCTPENTGQCLEVSLVCTTAGSNFSPNRQPPAAKSCPVPNVTGAVVEKLCSLAELENGSSSNTPHTYLWKLLHWSESWPRGPDAEPVTEFSTSWWLWGSYLTSLCLTSLICKMGLLMHS